MREHREVISAIGLGLGLAMALVPGAAAQQNPVTAIDIALEPDATMVQHAMAANARLLKSFPKGFSLDATHHPHVSMLQQFVRADDLDKIYAAAQAVFDEEKPKSWTLKAFKYYYIPSPPIGLAGNRRRTNGRSASAAGRAHQGGRALRREDWDAGGVLQRRGGTGHPAIPHQLRREFRERRGRQALQSACDDRRRNGSIFERNAGGAIPVVHVLAGGGLVLSARFLWHGPEGAQGIDAVALSQA